MDVFYDAVGFEEGVGFVIVGDDGAVIAGADDDVLFEWEVGCEGFYEVVLAGVGDVHWEFGYGLEFGRGRELVAMPMMVEL